MQWQVNKDKGVDHHLPMRGIDGQLMHGRDVLGGHVVTLLQINLIGELSAYLVQGPVWPITKPVQYTPSHKQNDEMD